MKKIILFIFLATLISGNAQEIKKKKDTLIINTLLNEVIIIGKKRKDIDYKKHIKPLSTLDQYLEKSSKINMIKRGNYAWEPSINNMLSDRISVTIDGMQIFGACTDKMDPITSYVDVSNLEKMNKMFGFRGGSR